MDPTTPFDWHRMFFGVQPPLFLLEIVVRVAAIYLFAAVVMRVMGNRGQRSLSPFETVVIIALGSAVGDGMFYPEVPILYAWVVISAVVLFDVALDKAQLRVRWINRVVEGGPLLLVRDGALVEEGLKAARLRRSEVMGLLREEGIEDTGEIRYAFLEGSGELGVLRYAPGDVVPRASTLPDDFGG